jgi:hypothetical protein
MYWFPCQKCALLRRRSVPFGHVALTISVTACSAAQAGSTSLASLSCCGPGKAAKCIGQRGVVLWLVKAPGPSTQVALLLAPGGELDGLVSDEGVRMATTGTSAAHSAKPTAARVMTGIVAMKAMWR